MKKSLKIQIKNNFLALNFTSQCNGSIVVNLQFFKQVLDISIGINMGMIFFLTSEVMEAVRGQKHLSEAKKGTKELIYWKKCLIKVAQQPQKPPIGSNQI